MPHYLKKFFWMSLADYSSFESNNTYSSDNDSKFFSDFDKAGGFSYSDSYDRAVRIYDLQGADSPYRLTSKGEKDPDGTSLKEQIEGDFHCVLNMLQNLKDAGKYKNSRIIITADCGELEYGQLPLLLYKERGYTEGYKLDSSLVSLFDLPATLASAVTDDYKDIGTGISFTDAAKQPWNRRRLFYLNTGENAESRIEAYKTNSKAIGEKDLKLINTYYINGGRIDNYKLGTELTFTEDETAVMYCKQGFGHTNGWRTIVSGPTAEMEIPIDEIPENIEDLHAYSNVLNIYEETGCVVLANGEEVFNDRLGTDIRMNGLNFLIPADVIGSDKKLDLKFIFPEIEHETEIMALTSFKIYNQ